MTVVINIEGKRFGRLVVVGRTENDKHGRARWRCKCDCGGELDTTSINLRCGDTKSCGCLLREMGAALGKLHGGKNGNASRTHGHATKGHVTPTYRSWQHMKDRCGNQDAHNYKHYGGRGISVCRRWLSGFANFLEDMGERPEGKTIDRKDNSANYTPDNCHWATAKEQANNRRQPA